MGGFATQTMSADGGGAGGSFNPSGLPVVDDGAAVRAAAAALNAAVSGVSAQSVSVRSAWVALAASYHAPEDSDLVAAMDEPRTWGASFVSRHEAAHQALTTYAGKLDELNARRAGLVSAMVKQNAAWAEIDARRSQATVSGDHATGTVEWSDPTLESDASALASKDKQVMEDAAQFASDVVAADIACGNAISAIFGGTQYHLGGLGSGEGAVGGTKDVYLSLARHGGADAPWGVPQSWSDPLTSGQRWADQVVDDGKQTASGLWDMLTDWSDDGRGAAAREGMGQSLADIGVTASVPLIALDHQRWRGAAGRTFGPMVSWGNWSTDPAGAQGDLAFGVVAAATTRGVGKGAGALTGAALRSGTAVALRESALAAGSRGLAGVAAKARNWSGWQVPRYVPRGELMPALDGAGVPGGAAGLHRPFGKLAGGADRLDSMAGVLQSKAAKPLPGTGGKEQPVPHMSQERAAYPTNSPWRDPGARKAWVTELKSLPSENRPVTSDTPAMRYQRKVLGSVETRVQGGGAKVWADNVHIDPDAVVVADAKFVLQPGSPRAMFEGRAPDFLWSKVDNELRRYGAVIGDPDNPIARLRIVTNTDEAARVIGERARRILGPTIDVDVVVREG